MIFYPTDYRGQLRRLQCNEHWTGKVDLDATVMILFNYFPADSETTRLWPARQCGECVCVQSLVRVMGVCFGLYSYIKQIIFIE